MTSTAKQYQAALRPLTAVVETLQPNAWNAPSPCEGWTARDVVGHMVQTQREMLNGHGVDLGDAPDLKADPAQAWRHHAGRVLHALADEALIGRTYDGHFGPTTVGETLEQFYVWDMYVHRWDLAHAAALPAELTDAELDRIEQGPTASAKPCTWRSSAAPASQSAPTPTAPPVCLPGSAAPPAPRCAGCV